MADDTRAQEAAEEQTQLEPMPSSEQQGTAPELNEVGSSSAEETANEDSDDGLQLPGGASDRTREQFEKLKKQNQELKREMQKRRQTESVFDSTRQQPGLVQSPSIEQYADPTTGYIDVDRFNRDVAQIAQQAQMARKEVQQFIEQQQEVEAYSSHPDLNPDSDSFDEALHRSTRAALLDSIVNPQEYGGKQLTLKQAADSAKGLMGRGVEKVKKQAAQEAIEKLAPKEQASLEATGRSDRRREAGMSYAELQQRTRMGDREAITARLQGLPIEGHPTRSR